MTGMRKTIMTVSAAAVLVLVLVAVLLLWIFRSPPASGDIANAGGERQAKAGGKALKQQPGKSPAPAGQALLNDAPSEVMAWLRKNPQWRPVRFQNPANKPESDIPQELLEKQPEFEKVWNDMQSKGARLAAAKAEVFDPGLKAGMPPANAVKSFGILFEPDKAAWAPLRKQFQSGIEELYGAEAGGEILARLQRTLAATTGSFGEFPWAARIWLVDKREWTIDPIHAPGALLPENHVYEFQLASGHEALDLFLEFPKTSLGQKVQSSALSAVSGAVRFGSKDVPAILREVVTFEAAVEPSIK